MLSSSHSKIHNPRVTGVSRAPGRSAPRNCETRGYDTSRRWYGAWRRGQTPLLPTVEQQRQDATDRPAYTANDNHPRYMRAKG